MSMHGQAAFWLIVNSEFLHWYAQRRRRVWHVTGTVKISVFWNLVPSSSLAVVTLSPRRGRQQFLAKENPVFLSCNELSRSDAGWAAPASNIPEGVFNNVHILFCIFFLVCIFCFRRANWHSSAILTEVFQCFFLSSSVARQMPRYNSQSWGTARTLPN